jgi:DNA-binding transcriptional LysR family regulator
VLRANRKAGRSPGVRLRFIAESSSDTPELRRGEVDLEANAGRASSADLRSEQVAGEIHHVIVVRRGHPLTRTKTITPAQYAEAEHITVSRRGRLSNTIDEELAKLGLTRQVVASAATEAAAFAFVRSTNLHATVPTATATAALDLALLPLPLESPPAAVFLSWHQRYDTDPAHAWLRDLARTALQSVGN